MWKVIYIAPSLKVADRMLDHLSEEGLMATKRDLSVGEEGGGPVEIMVPQSEAAEAHEILSRLLCSHAARPKSRP
jgi:hypothetical protein